MLGQGSRARPCSATAPGQVRSLDDLAGPQQAPRRDALLVAHHVQVVVHPVAEIAVQVPGFTEHGGVAGGAAPEGVRPGVGRSRVRLHLRDADGDGAVAGRPGQCAAEQQRCEVEDGAAEPVTGCSCEAGKVHREIVPRSRPARLRAQPERLLAANARGR